MDTNTATCRHLKLRHRLGAAAAAASITAGIVSALLLSFDNASPGLWLAPSPEVMEMAADCDRHALRSLRDECKKTLVAARLQPGKPATRFAVR